jgi:hypothetical protein
LTHNNNVTCKAPALHAGQRESLYNQQFNLEQVSFAAQSAKVGGLSTIRIQLPIALETAWFLNPRAYEVKSWFPKFEYKSNTAYP